MGAFLLIELEMGPNIHQSALNRQRERTADQKWDKGEHDLIFGTATIFCGWMDRSDCGFITTMLFCLKGACVANGCPVKCFQFD